MIQEQKKKWTGKNITSTGTTEWYYQVYQVIRIYQYSKIKVKYKKQMTTEAMQETDKF